MPSKSVKHERSPSEDELESSPQAESPPTKKNRKLKGQDAGDDDGAKPKTRPKKAKPWSQEESKKLFQALYPRQVGTSWKEVAALFEDRDVKVRLGMVSFQTHSPDSRAQSCQNRSLIAHQERNRLTPASFAELQRSTSWCKTSSRRARKRRGRRRRSEKTERFLM